jgi:maltose-binding protein MalE
MTRPFTAICIAALILAACESPEATKTPSATQVSPKTPRPSQVVDAASGLGVEEEALQGLQIDVWHPWFGVEAGLFQTMVEDFNGTNPWGINVNASGLVNFGNLYEEVTISLPTVSRPDLVVALPEHALGWDAEGVSVEMTPYIEDPLYGMDPTDIPACSGARIT